MKQNNLYIEQMLQKLALFVAQKFNLDSIDASGVVCNSQTASSFLMQKEKQACSFEDLKKSLMQEVLLRQ